MPQVPEELRDFIARAYDSEMVVRIEEGRWGSTPDAMDTTVFVDDFLRRPAFWAQIGLDPLNDEQKQVLASWVAELAPNGIQRYREGLEREANRHVRAENERVVVMIRDFFPQAFQVIFDSI